MRYPRVILIGGAPMSDKTTVASRLAATLGYGCLWQALCTHACTTARGLGNRSMVWGSAPNADGFYRRMGARTIGERRSSTLPVEEAASLLAEAALVVGEAHQLLAKVPEEAQPVRAAPQ
jgi:hypothetical protein